MAEDQEKMQEEMPDETAGNASANEAAEGAEVAVEANLVTDDEGGFPQVAAGSLKAESDLASARASVNRVAVAQEQLQELMGAWLGDGSPEDASAAVVNSGVAAEMQSASTQVSYYPAQDPAQAVVQTPAQAPVQAAVQTPGQTPAQVPVQAPMQNPALNQAQAPAASAQDNYWQGFQPVQPTQPVQAFPQQAQPVAPTPAPYGQPAYGQQAYGQPAAAQPVAAQPVQQPYQQAAPAARQAQRFAPQPQMPAQPQAQPQAYQTQPQVQPQAQPYQAQTQAQPAGYSPAYTPQIQQPAGYVPAQDFTVQPQPQTPEYTKSNKATVGIVLVLIIGILAIIASIVLGRILASNATDYESPLIDQLTQFDDGSGSGEEPYSDHQPGGSDESKPGGTDESKPHGSDSSTGGSSEGPLAFNWDEDEEIDWDDPMWEEYHGAQHVTGGGIDADDGELHSALVPTKAYEVTEAEYKREGTEKVSYYQKTVAYDFDVEYPQLKGDIKDLEKINKAIEEKAMRFVDMTYTNPTSDARSLLETYAVSGFGVPADADAILESDVDYAVTFNNDDFMSIAFSDEQAIGSWSGGFIALYTVNVNLKTGEVYELKDVLKINDEIAGHFVDNLSKYDEGTAEAIAGRDSLIGAIQGKGSNAKDVTSTFFIDGNGKVNLGVSYRLDSSTGTARGWWDYTLTDEELQAAKKDSSLWDVIGVKADSPAPDSETSSSKSEG